MAAARVGLCLPTAVLWALRSSRLWRRWEMATGGWADCQGQLALYAVCCSHSRLAPGCPSRHVGLPAPAAGPPMGPHGRVLLLHTPSLQTPSHFFSSSTPSLLSRCTPPVFKRSIHFGLQSLCHPIMLFLPVCTHCFERFHLCACPALFSLSCSCSSRFYLQYIVPHCDITAPDKGKRCWGGHCFSRATRLRIAKLPPWLPAPHAPGWPPSPARSRPSCCSGWHSADSRWRRCP